MTTTTAPRIVATGRSYAIVRTDDDGIDRMIAELPELDGVRVIDGRGTGSIINNCGLPELCDPREWVWVDWDGERGVKVCRVADLRPVTPEETST